MSIHENGQDLNRQNESQTADIIPANGYSLLAEIKPGLDIPQKNPIFEMVVKYAKSPNFELELVVGKPSKKAESENQEKVLDINSRQIEVDVRWPIIWERNAVMAVGPHDQEFVISSTVKKAQKIGLYTYFIYKTIPETNPKSINPKPKVGRKPSITAASFKVQNSLLLDMEPENREQELIRAGLNENEKKLVKLVLSNPPDSPPTLNQLSAGTGIAKGSVIYFARKAIKKLGNK